MIDDDSTLQYEPLIVCTVIKLSGALVRNNRSIGIFKGFCLQVQVEAALTQVKQ
jgi:hypothetical protein